MNNKQRYENLQHGYFDCDGAYDTPIIQPVKNVPDITEFIGFNYAKTTPHKSGKGCHFFLDDYQFERLWNRPNDYINMLSKFGCVLSPDFSLYADFPTAMQIYNHYRKHWLAAYWQLFGITVIPTVGWSDERSFAWCFDGEPVGGVVAVSSVGTQNSKTAKAAFQLGYNEMIKRLEPSTIIFYGNVPDECRGNIVKINAFQNKWKEADQWAAEEHQAE